MHYRIFLVAAILALPAASMADALFGNGIAGDRELPRTWGIGMDYFDMSQPYQFDALSIGLPELAALIQDPSILPIDNNIRHTDLKVDVWVLPFLNVFGIYGRIDGETDINLGVLGLPLPANTNNLRIDYDGDVYGGGVVLVVGGERWFASLTGTWTNTDLEGDFSSSVKARTVQPRIGIRAGDTAEFWIGGYILDAEEKHEGSLALDLGPLVAELLQIPPVVDVAFDVDLSQKKDFNPSVGMHVKMSEAWEATVEVGGGDRRVALGNITYRFD